MARKRKSKIRWDSEVFPVPVPVANVVVYRNPGPDECNIEEHVEEYVKAHSMYGIGGALGYLTLVESDFDRLWAAVDRGDAYGTAFSVLPFLGPKFSQFVGQIGDFIFGWTGGEDPRYGKVLLLQIVPQRHKICESN